MRGHISISLMTLERGANFIEDLSLNSESGKLNAGSMTIEFSATKTLILLMKQD